MAFRNLLMKKKKFSNNKYLFFLVVIVHQTTAPLLPFWLEFLVTTVVPCFYLIAERYTCVTLVIKIPFICCWTTREQMKWNFHKFVFKAHILNFNSFSTETQNTSSQGFWYFSAIPHLWNSGKSTKSHEIHKNMQNPMKFPRNLIKYLLIQQNYLKLILAIGDV